MKKFEKILGLIFLLALILKFNLIVGGNILTYFSLLLLALIYYPLGFAFFNDIPLKKVFKKNSYKGLSAWKIIGSIVLGMGFSGICLGTLFKLLNWPEAKLNLIAGLGTIFIVFIIALIRFYKTRSNFYNGIFKRIALIGGFGLIMLVTSELTLVKIQYRNHPKYIDAYEKYMENPDNRDLQIKLDIEYHRATFPKEEFDLYMKYDVPKYQNE